MTYTAMGRARRTLNRFMSDVMEGWKEDRAKGHYRIDNNVGDIIDDYDYGNSDINSVYSPNRRFSEIIRKPQQNILVKKIDPKLTGVVDMLKNLQPKTNSTRKNNDPIVATKWETSNHPKNIFIPQNVNRSFPDQHLVENLKPLPLTLGKRNAKQFMPSPLPAPKVAPVYKTDRIDHSHLPKFEDLPPADFSFIKHGVHHHIHDLRKHKLPLPKKHVEWISADFADTILSAFGLSTPGRSVKHTIAKCSKIYILQAVIRFIRTALVG